MRNERTCQCIELKLQACQLGKLPDRGWDATWRQRMRNAQSRQKTYSIRPVAPVSQTQTCTLAKLRANYVRSSPTRIIPGHYSSDIIACRHHGKSGGETWEL